MSPLIPRTYLSCTVPECCDGWPLWQVAEEFLAASSAVMRRARRAGDALLLDGVSVRSTMPVRGGQTVSIDVADRLFDGAKPTVRPEPGLLDIVYSDQDLIVVNKPAGIAAHPCPGHKTGTVGNWVLYRLHELNDRCVLLHPIHRLDLGTSGLLFFATTGYAQELVQRRMHSDFVRSYLAVCEGVFASEQGVVDAPIARASPTSIRRSIRPDGQNARTHYQVIGRLAGNRSLVALRLETGRTHQIRVHLAHIGHPLAGDTLYGGSLDQTFDRPTLHAWHARLAQPVTGIQLELWAPLPCDFAQAVQQTDLLDRARRATDDLLRELTP